MRSSNQFLLIMFTFFSTFVYSQEPRLKITEAYITTGFSGGESSSSSHSDFQMLAPNSQILENNPGALDASPEYYSPYRSSGRVSLQTGIQFLNKEKNEFRKSPTLRLGLRYTNVNQINAWTTIEERTPYDTLIGQNTGSVHYLDSVKSKSINGDYVYERISLDASLIFRTNQDLRWSVYGGIGFSFGLSMNANTDLSYSESNFTDVRGQSNEEPYYYGMNNDNARTENHKNKNAIGGSLYVPFGVDFRLGKNSPFWNMFHLYAEAQPGISFQNIPELDKTISQTGMFLNSGIRVRW